MACTSFALPHPAANNVAPTRANVRYRTFACFAPRTSARLRGMASPFDPSILPSLCPPSAQSSFAFARRLTVARPAGSMLNSRQLPSLSKTTLKPRHEQMPRNTVAAIEGDRMEKAFQALLDEWEGVKGNVIPLLQKTQEIFGFLPEESMREIARVTG